MRSPQERLDAWNRVAPGWERRRHVVWSQSSHVSEWLVDRAGIRAGYGVLELAAGTGETAGLISDRVGAGGRVIASDFSPAMVDVIARTIGDRPNVDRRVIDAHRIDLPDRCVDAVVCRFAYNLMPDPAAAIAESRRVLVAGGPLALAVWGARGDNPWITSITDAVVAAGLIELDDPTAPGGMFSLADDDRLRTLVARAGFSSVQVERLDHPWRYETIDALWQTQSDLSGILSAVLSALDAATQRRLRADVEDRLEPFRAAAGYLIPGSVLCAVAR